MNAADILWLTQLHDFSVSRMLYVITRLDIPDLLETHPGSSAVRLAELAGADADGLERVLRALSAVGLIITDDAGGYRNTPASRLLRVAGDGIAHEIRIQAEYVAFADIEKVLRTGAAAMDDRGGFYRVLDQNEEWSRDFRLACQSRSGRLFTTLLRNHAWQDSELVLDIGGGNGHHLETALLARPELRGVLLDSVAGIDLARERSWPAGVRERVGFVAADYLADPFPQADTGMLVNVLHNLSDRGAEELLTGIRSRSSCRRLVIGEYVLPDQRGVPHPGLVADVWMLVAVGGRERTRPEFDVILSKSGWRITDVVEDRTTRGALITCGRV